MTGNSTGSQGFPRASAGEVLRLLRGPTGLGAWRGLRVRHRCTLGLAWAAWGGLRQAKEVRSAGESAGEVSVVLRC